MSRRCAKRLGVIGAVLTALVSVALLASLMLEIRWLRPVAAGAVDIHIVKGTVFLDWWTPATPHAWGWTLSTAMDESFKWRWRPGCNSIQTSTFSSRAYWLPLWMPLVVTAQCTALFVRTVRRRRTASCPSCGYDLSGNTSGVCPECGHQFAAPSLRAMWSEAGFDTADDWRREES